MKREKLDKVKNVVDMGNVHWVLNIQKMERDMLDLLLVVQNVTLLKTKDAIVFVFDEPMAALEPDRKVKVWNMIQEETKNKRLSIQSWLQW